MNKNKITLFVLIFAVQFLITVKNSYGQWQQCNGINDGIVYSFAISGNNFFAGTSNGIYLSSNNGASWVQMGLNFQHVSSLVISGNNIFAGVRSLPGNGVYLSTNNGASWTQTANERQVYSLAISGNNIFAGVFFYGLFMSTNNGVNWTQTSLNNGNVHSLIVLDNNIFAGTDNGVYLSTNNGLNWTQTALNNQSVRSFAISNNNFFAGTDNGVYHSTNNGASWVPTALNNLYANVRSLAISANNIFAGSYTDGIYLSTNYGISWVQKNQGFNGIPGINALLIENNYIFAGTENASAWRCPVADIIGVQNISSEIPSAFWLSQNYPNPFNPTTKIKFDILKTGFTTLKVYDLVGKEVQTMVSEELHPGMYEASFDANQLMSGVYFYRLSSGEYSETKKMLLVK